MNGGSDALFGFLISLVWFATAVFDYLFYTYTWQLKEYRLDRMKDYLKSVQGRNFLKDFRFIWRGIGAVLLFLKPISFISLCVLFFDIFYTFFFLKQKFRRPKFTKKAILICIFSLIIEAGLFSLFPYNLPFILFVRIFSLSLIVFLLGIPSTLIKRYIIRKATAKLAQYKDLIVIGITGSFGKSSVKEFTSHILSTQYKVRKTPKNINSEIGIAQFILKTSFAGVDVFVCEMGAYTKGEIDLICKMVRPKIGVLTTIGEQHLSLFGSIKNIQSAKYELLRSLPADGLVITNADNAYCREFLKDLTCQNIETYGIEKENDPTYRITKIKTTLRGIEFEALYCGQKAKITAPVLGAHNAFNISMALMVAVNMSIDPNNIISAVNHLPKDLQGILKTYNYGQTTIIDDSYNSNPSGFRSALNVLSLYPTQRKKIVITRGMLELGEKSNELHEEIAKEIAEFADELIVITPDFIESLHRGAGPEFLSKIKTMYTADELFTFLKNLHDTDAVILLENRMPAKVIQELEKHRK